MAVLLAIGIAGIIAAIFLSLTALGVFTNEATGVSKSLAVMEAFSTAPESLKKELQPSFQNRVLVPLLDRLVGLGRRLTPSDYAERILQKLNVAGNPSGWTVERVMSLKVLGIGAGLVGGLVLGIMLGKGTIPVLMFG